MAREPDGERSSDRAALRTRSLKSAWQAVLRRSFGSLGLASTKTQFYCRVTTETPRWRFPFDLSTYGRTRCSTYSSLRSSPRLALIALRRARFDRSEFRF